MKKVAVTAIPYAIPLRQPLQTARHRFVERRGWWLAVRDEEGRLGLGEVAPIPWSPQEPYDAVAAIVDSLHQASVEPCELRARGQRFGSIASGIDLALLDLEAQRSETRVADLLSPEVRRSLPCHYLLRGGSPEALRAEAAEAVASGFRALKIKLGAGSIDQDAARLAAVREQIGPEISLRGDANGAWDQKTAVRALERFARYDLDFVEQPVAQNLELLRGRVPVPIAADESASTAEGARRTIQSRAAEVVIVKPMCLGGVRVSKEIAEEADAAGLRVVVTSVLDTQVGLAGAAHLAAALRTEEVCGLATGDLFTSSPATGIAPIERGSLRLPSGPGLGVRLHPALLVKHGAS
jgi:o-succinylbenzoate synthase